MRSSGSSITSAIRNHSICFSKPNPSLCSSYRKSHLMRYNMSSCSSQHAIVQNNYTPSTTITKTKMNLRPLSRNNPNCVMMNQSNNKLLMYQNSRYSSSVSLDEVNKFSNMSKIWWDPAKVCMISK